MYFIHIYTYVYFTNIFPFCISPHKQSQFNFISSFYPLNLNLPSRIDHAKRRSGGGSCQPPSVRW